MPDKKREITEHQDQSGKFVKGNKAASKRSPYRRERLLRGLTHEQLQKLLRDTYDEALEGDKSARDFLLNKYIATPKPQAGRVMFDLDITSLDKAAASILVAVSAGQVNIDDAEALMRILSQGAVVGEQKQLARRIAELEAQQGIQNEELDITPQVIHLDMEEGKPEVPKKPDWLLNAKGIEAVKGFATHNKEG